MKLLSLTSMPLHLLFISLDAPEIKSQCQVKIKEELATVPLNGQQSYANKMIQQGLARPYEGKKRQGWCR